jgi:CRP-like cAMP-binding protein
MDLFSFFDSISKISPEAQQALQQIIQEKKFSKNEIIQDIGSSCRTVYLVKSGSARIFYFKDGNDITEHFAFENEMIVRAESLFSGQPTSKGIQTMDETVMYAIDAFSLFKLYDEHHDLERLFRYIFEREYVNVVKRLESLQFKSAKERYLDLLKSTDYVNKIPLKYIASYLGITQVSLSRIRADIS